LIRHLRKPSGSGRARIRLFQCWMAGEITENLIGAEQKAFGHFDAVMLGEIHIVFDHVPPGAGPFILETAVRGDVKQAEGWAEGI
jgi:hypothetical protein